MKTTFSKSRRKGRFQCLPHCKLKDQGLGLAYGKDQAQVEPSAEDCVCVGMCVRVRVKPRLSLVQRSVCARMCVGKRVKPRSSLVRRIVCVCACKCVLGLGLSPGSAYIFSTLRHVQNG